VCAFKYVFVGEKVVVDKVSIALAWNVAVPLKLDRPNDRNNDHGFYTPRTRNTTHPQRL
jgi:hypothetical protein